MFNLKKKQFSLPPIDKKECLRYASVTGVPNENIALLLEECLEEAKQVANGKVCYCTLPKEEFYRLAPSATQSESLQKYLWDCNDVVLFAATIGIEIDGLIRRYASIAPVKSLFFQALGAERIECLCDVFSYDYSEKELPCNKLLKARRSPGYGDFALTSQKEFFQILQPEKYLGVTLTNSFMMSPTKSVTAIIGIQSKQKE